MIWRLMFWQRRTKITSRQTYSVSPLVEGVREITWINYYERGWRTWWQWRLKSIQTQIRVLYAPLS